MNPILIAELFGLAAAVARSPSVGQESLAKLLEMGHAAVNAGVRGEQDLIELKIQMQRMVDEDRDPTKQEWDSLRDRNQTAGDIIQGWRPEGEEGDSQ